MFKTIGFAVGVLCVSAGLASAQVLYGTSPAGLSPSSLYTVDASTGLATLVGATGFSGIGSLSFSPGGILFGVANGSSRSLVRINTTTGAATLIGATGATRNISDIAFRSDGTLFAVDGGSGFYSINTTTGAATSLGSLSSGSPTGGGLAFNAAGTLFLADDDELFTVNQTNGVTTLVGTLNFSAFPSPGNSRFAGMKFHPTTGVLFGSVLQDFDPASITRLGSASSFSGTIAVTNIGDPGVVLEAVAFAAGVAVPVLPSWGLAGLGILLAALAVWTLGRRRSNLETI